jgi:hypothetical protein
VARPPEPGRLGLRARDEKGKRFARPQAGSDTSINLADQFLAVRVVAEVMQAEYGRQFLIGKALEVGSGLRDGEPVSEREENAEPVEELLSMVFVAPSGQCFEKLIAKGAVKLGTAAEARCHIELKHRLIEGEAPKLEPPCLARTLRASQFALPESFDRRVGTQGLQS